MRTQLIVLVIVAIMIMTPARAFKLSGNTLYEMGCMKQCGSYFSKCYKYCYTSEEERAAEGDLFLEKRNQACLDECIVKLATCHHYCARK